MSAMRADVREIKAALSRLVPLIDEFRGFMTATIPTLATKKEVEDLRVELKSEVADLRAELRLAIMQRPHAVNPHLTCSQLST
jgi:hypothetical protein